MRCAGVAPAAVLGRPRTSASVLAGTQGRTRPEAFRRPAMPLVHGLSRAVFGGLQRTSTQRKSLEVKTQLS